MKIKLEPNTWSEKSMPLDSVSACSASSCSQRLPVKRGLITRIDAELNSIGAYLRAHHPDLPAEVRRDRFLDDSHMFRALNVYLQGRILDDFFRKHEACRKWAAHVFSCRYPYLWDLGSGVDDEAHRQPGEPSKRPNSGRLTGETASGMGPSKLGLGPSEAQTGTRTEDGSEMTWVPDMDDKATAQAYAGAQSRLVQMAVDAFHNFEIAPDARKLRRPDTGQPLTCEELDALEELLLIADMSGPSKGKDLETEPLMWTELELELGPLSLDSTPSPSQHALSKYIDSTDSNANDGPRELALDFPNVRPNKESASSPSLPNLPGPNVALAAVIEEPKSRRWLYDNVESIHDAQYGMPGDILVDCYLKRYREDACDFWANAKTRAKQQERQDTRLNVMRHENEHYEACMRGGMGYTAEFLVHEGDFHFSPEDITRAQDGTMRTTDKQLKSFARLRGGKRAALQQCLNMFDSFENRVAGGPCRTLVLPPPVARRRQDINIVVDGAMLNDPSEESSGDSRTYTKWYIWFVKERQRCADLARESAVKESYELKKRLGRKDPVMALPRNLNDVVVADGMDQDMRRTWATLKKHRALDRALRQANSRAPRQLMDRIVTLVAAGMSGHDWKKLGLPLRPDEHVPDKDDHLARIRARETKWLRLLCRPVPCLEAELNEPLDRRGRVFLSRVEGMLNDLNPTSFFNDTSPKPLDDFLVEVNRACRGPVKRYRFTREDVMRDAPKLDELGLLRFAAHGSMLRDQMLIRCSTSLDSGGRSMIGRAQPKIHPEQRIRWDEREDEEMVDAERGDLDESPIQDKFPSFEEDSDSSIFSSEEGDAFDIPGLPDRTNLRSLKECIKRPEQVAKDQPRTEIFFSCLAYCLGKTIRELEAQHESDQNRLDANDGQLREANNDFLADMIDIWTDEIEKQSEDSRGNGQDRGLPMYQDVVTAAELEAGKPFEWEAMDAEKVEAECRTLVRNGVLREMDENKTTLFPLPLDVTGENGSSTLRRGPEDALHAASSTSNEPPLPHAVSSNSSPPSLVVEQNPSQSEQGEPPSCSNDELPERPVSGVDTPRAFFAEEPRVATWADGAHPQTPAEAAGTSRTRSAASSSLSLASLRRVASPRGRGWMSSWKSPMRSEALALRVVEPGDEWE
ncbi:Uncharacterized protein TCAP_07147 [Tolypocladium capitatum]|uniref:Uncharacterized protein n=1 Tax=Tolypocladium capitatum TaxID=45235 RepID=A0A2K3Q4M9_9HYPO|nr:Uncharacterized protein TCAP_07147 [Tolypocladium capitatum]